MLPAILGKIIASIPIISKKTIACNCVLDILLFFIFIPPYKNFLSFYQEEI